MTHDHDHGSGHHHGSGDKTKVLYAATLTGGFMLVEVVGGLWTGSLALLADAGHMLADTIALGLAWYAFHLADRPATTRLSYGFHRVKPLVAYTNGLTIFAIALWIVYEAWRRFLAPPEVLGGPMLVIAICGMLVNIAGFLILRSGDRGSLNMRGAILHVLGDLLGSGAAIVAALVILATGWMPVDPILSVLVAALILSTAFALMREATHVLLEGVPSAMDREDIAKDLETHVDGLLNVHHVHVWSLDGAKNVATLHACLRAGVDAPSAVRAIKTRLVARHGISHVTVEPEYDTCADGREAVGHAHHPHDQNIARATRH